jgi:sec-independent protein translocase protein TatA
MGSFSIWHWLVVLAVILVLFGGGNKISGLMGDFAKGIKSFKKNMAEREDATMEETTAKPRGSLAGPGDQDATSNSGPSTTH